MTKLRGNGVTALRSLKVQRPADKGARYDPAIPLRGPERASALLRMTDANAPAAALTDQIATSD